MKRKEPQQNNKSNSEEVMESERLENPKKIQKQDPIQKEQKYDRQLRLWGNDGQHSLEHANICVINATATATETLKCLVLPGISKYYIVDDALVSNDDLSSNFFVDTSSEGKPRAQVACELLQELNPDSHGKWIKEKAVCLLDNDPEFFSSFTAVVCSRVSEHDILKISHYLWEHDIPLFIVDSIGMFGYLRIVLQEHAVVKAHPDNTLADLRLDQPFPELVEYCNSMDLAKMDNLEHSHTPYLVILYKAMKQWQQQSGLKWPANYKEKCQIKEVVKGLILKNEDGVPLQEENFEEALINVNNGFSATHITSGVKELFENPIANHPLKSRRNPKFWILLRALKEFATQNGVLPLRGSLPDMFSDSIRYIELQNIYKSKAESDVQQVEELVRESLIDLQLPMEYITREEIQTFCRNSAFLHVQYGLSYHDEICQSLVEHKIQETLLSHQDDGGLNVYLCFRGLHAFLNKSGNTVVQPEERNFYYTAIDEVMKSCGVDHLEKPKRTIEEMLRGNLAEFHAMASVMGGIAAQEVIKIVTSQFVPVDNTLVMNNIESVTVSIKL